MNRVVVAASVAAGVGILIIALTAAYRFLDWLFQGSPIQWLGLIGTMVVAFLFILVLDFATDHTE